MTDAERERFWDEFDASVRALQADPGAWDEYWREFKELEDATIADGLEPEDWTGYFADEEETADGGSSTPG